MTFVVKLGNPSKKKIKKLQKFLNRLEIIKIVVLMLG